MFIWTNALYSQRPIAFGHHFWQTFVFFLKNKNIAGPLFKKNLWQPHLCSMLWTLQYNVHVVYQFYLGHTRDMHIFLVFRDSEVTHSLHQALVPYWFDVLFGNFIICTERELHGCTRNYFYLTNGVVDKKRFHNHSSPLVLRRLKFFDFIY